MNVDSLAVHLPEGRGGGVPRYGSTCIMCTGTAGTFRHHMVCGISARIHHAVTPPPPTPPGSPNKQTIKQVCFNLHHPPLQTHRQLVPDDDRGMIQLEKVSSAASYAASWKLEYSNAEFKRLSSGTNRSGRPLSPSDSSSYASTTTTNNSCPTSSSGSSSGSPPYSSPRGSSFSSASSLTSS